MSSRRWLDRVEERVSAMPLGPGVDLFGRVRSVGDGIAMVSGLPDLQLDELIVFENGQLGFVKTLEPDIVSCVLLDSTDQIKADDRVRGTGDVVRVPVGPALLGRVVDPMGRPLDDQGAVDTPANEAIEGPAPAVVERGLITEPVQTGILSIDALFPIGRGQRGAHYW